MELIEKLGIDWKLLIAQIVNFFILLAVLYKFVYKPVLSTLDKRSKTIEKGIHDAKKSEERLEQIEREREEKLAKAEKEIGLMFAQAKKDAESIKDDIVKNAASQGEDLLRRAKVQIEEQKQAMLEEVKAEVVTFIVKATGKLLEKEFTSADQKRLTDAITQEMKSV